MTKRRLAELVQVTDRGIAGFEKGEYSPDPDTLDRIAHVLDFPIDFFEAEDLEEIPASETSFRSMSRMTAAQRDAAEVGGAFALAFHDWITTQFRLPPPNVPRLGPGVDPETAAGIVRAEWNLGQAPIPNLIHLLEVNGVRVFSLAEDTREVDAFSFYRGETPFVFLNTVKTPEHSRMDAAHELGHLVLHAHHQILPHGKIAEKEAQLFGAAFLMPKDALIASVPRIASIGTLTPHKRKWRVSLAALVYRLHEIGALTDWQYRTLNIDLSKQGLRTNEDKSIPRETSQIIAKVFASLRKRGVLKDEIAAELHLHPKDLDALVFRLAMIPVTGQAQPEIRSPSKPELRVFRGGADAA
jgi:Zn-dependent peptidase ImmA (M78 family)/transcriptional regulator with XRE-family HTH domain